MIALWGYLHINFNEPSKRFLFSWNNQSTTNFCIFDFFYKKKHFFLRKGLDDDNNRGLLVGGEIKQRVSASFPATAMKSRATTLFRANNSSESRHPTSPPFREARGLTDCATYVHWNVFEMLKGARDICPSRTVFRTASRYSSRTP